MISDERPKLSGKWQISEKLFETLANAKSLYINIAEYLGHWSRYSEIAPSYILKVLLRLLLCLRNAPNYRQNEKFRETFFSSITWLLRTLFRYFNKNQRKPLASKASESVSEYESVFRICAWIIIHKTITINFFWLLLLSF